MPRDSRVVDLKAIKCTKEMSFKVTFRIGLEYFSGQSVS